RRLLGHEARRLDGAERLDVMRVEPDMLRREVRDERYRGDAERRQEALRERLARRPDLAREPDVSRVEVPDAVEEPRHRERARHEALRDLLLDLLPLGARQALD